MGQTYEPVLHVGDTILVEASIHNRGDATGERALANFVVPECFSLSSYGTPSPLPVMTSGNASAGTPPANVVDFIARERPFYVGLSWMHLYTLKVKRVPSNGGARLLMDLDEDRLNARGRRLLPSLVLTPRRVPPSAPYGTAWTNPKPRRTLHRIVVGNEDEVRCRAGNRQTVRDVKIQGTPQEASS